MTIARVVIRLSSWLVPADSRDEWRQEWLAEAAAIAARGRSPLRFATGAPVHAPYEAVASNAAAGAPAGISVRSMAVPVECCECDAMYPRPNSEPLCSFGKKRLVGASLRPSFAHPAMAREARVGR